MNPSTLEKLSALAFLFVGLTLMIFALNLMDIKVPFLGVVMIISALLSLVAGAFLFIDSMKQ